MNSFVSSCFWLSATTSDQQLCLCKVGKCLISIICYYIIADPCATPTVSMYMYVCVYSISIHIHTHTHTHSLAHWSYLAYKIYVNKFLFFIYKPFSLMAFLCLLLSVFLLPLRLMVGVVIVVLTFASCSLHFSLFGRSVFVCLFVERFSNIIHISFEHHFALLFSHSIIYARFPQSSPLIWDLPHTHTHIPRARETQNSLILLLIFATWFLINDAVFVGVRLFYKGFSSPPKFARSFVRSFCCRTIWYRCVPLTSVPTMIGIQCFLLIAWIMSTPDEHIHLAGSPIRMQKHIHVLCTVFEDGIYLLHELFLHWFLSLVQICKSFATQLFLLSRSLHGGTFVCNICLCLYFFSLLLFRLCVWLRWYFVWFSHLFLFTFHSQSYVHIFILYTHAPRDRYACFRKRDINVQFTYSIVYETNQWCVWWSRIVVNV